MVRLSVFPDIGEKLENENIRRDYCSIFVLISTSNTLSFAQYLSQTQIPLVNLRVKSVSIVWKAAFVGVYINNLFDFSIPTRTLQVDQNIFNNATIISDKIKIPPNASNS